MLGQLDRANNVNDAVDIVGKIAAEKLAPPWCGAVPAGVRGLAWRRVTPEFDGSASGYAWRIVDRGGRLEHSGFVEFR